jgi:hypothetical protein
LAGTPRQDFFPSQSEGILQRHGGAINTFAPAGGDDNPPWFEWWFAPSHVAHPNLPAWVPSRAMRKRDRLKDSPRIWHWQFKPETP